MQGKSLFNIWEISNSNAVNKINTTKILTVKYLTKNEA